MTIFIDFWPFYGYIKNIILTPFRPLRKTIKMGLFGYFHQTAKGGMWVHKCITGRRYRNYQGPVNLGSGSREGCCPKDMVADTRAPTLGGREELA